MSFCHQIKQVTHDVRRARQGLDDLIKQMSELSTRGTRAKNS